MALNNLIFGFGARDNGLTGAIKELTSEFKDLGKEILGLQRIQTMLSALSFDRLDEMADKLKSIGSAGVDLTGSLQATFTAYTKETKSFGAQTGYVGKELTKFTAQANSLAYSMNVGAGEAGKAVYGFAAATADGVTTAKDALKEMGVSGEADFIKLSQQAGISGDKLGYSLVQMQSQGGLTAKTVGEMSKMMVQFGMDVGDPAQGLGKLDELTAILSQRRMLGDNPQQVEAFGKGILTSADAFYKFTKDGPKAMTMATGLAKALTENKKGFQDLAAGAATALPEFVEKFSMAGTGVADAFASMNESPDVFLKKFTETIGNIKDKKQFDAAIEFFRAHAAKGFGEAGDDIVNMLKDATGRKALLAMDTNSLMEGSKNATKNLMAGFSDGLTDQDRFKRMQDQFDDRMRKMGTVSVKQFLKETKDSFNTFANYLTNLGKDTDSVSGTIVNKMSDIKKFGATGLFPADMRGPLLATGEAAESLISPLAKLRAAGINILSPFGLLTAAVAGLGAKFLSLKAKGMGTDEALENIGQSILDFIKVTLPKYAKLATTAMANFVKGLFMPMTNPLPKASGMAQNIGKALKQALIDAFSFAREAVTALWKGFTGELTAQDVLSGSDAQAIGAGIGIKLKQAFDYAKTEIVNYLKNWWKEMQTIWSDDSTTFTDKLQKSIGESGLLLLGGGLLAAFTPILPMLGTALNMTGTLVKLLFSVGGTLFKVFGWLIEIAPALWTGITGIWNVLSGFGSILSGIVDVVAWLAGTSSAMVWLVGIIAALTAGFLFFPDATQTAVDAVAKMAGGIGDILGSMIGWVAAWAVKLVGFMMFPFPALLEAFSWVVSGIFSLMTKLPIALASALNGLLEIAKQFVDGLITGIRDQLAAQFPAAAGPIFTVFNAIKDAVDVVVGVFQLGFTYVGEVLATLATLFGRVFGTISLIVEVAWNFIKAYLFDNLTQSLNVAGQVLGAFADFFYKAFWPIIDGLVVFFKAVYDGAVTKLTEGIQLIKDAFGSLRDVINNFFDKIDNWLKGFLPKSSEAAQNAGKAAEKSPPAPAQTPAPAAPPPAATGAGTPAGATATGPQVSALAPGGFSIGSLFGGEKKSGAKPGSSMPKLPSLGTSNKMPAGLGAATTPSNEPTVAQQTLNQALVDAVNNPAWVAGYLQLLKQQHAETMGALRKQPATPAATPGTPGTPPAAKKKPIPPVTLPQKR